jgi:hypothetical protein
VSYEVLIKLADGQQGGYFLGSTSDLIDLSNWVASLPGDLYPQLRSLVLDGEMTDVDGAVTEIDPALETHPPEVKGVAETADRLAEILDRWPEKTAASLGDGVNS